MPSGRHPPRSALDGNALPVAVGVRPGDGRVLEREAHVVGDEQVQVAIPVVVQEAASGSPARLGVQEPRRLRHVREGSVAVVPVEGVLPEAGAEEIFEAVVVVVPDADSGSPTHGTQAGLFRDIGERPVTIVLVEAVGRARRSAVEAGAREQEDIHPAVVVVVDERTAAARRLQDVLLAFDASIDRRRVQPGGGSDVDEVCVERAPGRGLPGQGLGGVSGNALCEEPLGGHRECRAERESHKGAARGAHGGRDPGPDAMQNGSIISAPTPRVKAPRGEPCGSPGVAGPRRRGTCRASGLRAVPSRRCPRARDTWR